MTLAKCSKFREGAIAVHKRGQVARSIVWKEAIGETPTKNLAKGRAIIDGCTMHLLTERIDPANFVNGPILAAVISTKFLNEILHDCRATDIVYLPWTSAELENFKRDHRDAISI